MLKLFVSDADATTGSIPISWCIDDETFLYMKEEGAKAPYVIIYITPEEQPGKVYIVRVPFKRMMTYIPLKFKGKNRIFGRIKFDDSGNYCPKDIRYADLEPREYDNEDKTTNKIFVRDFEVGKDYKDDSDFLLFYSKTTAGTYLSINVPAECFAKEPPEWEKAWVNAMIKGQPFDQCEFRRRRLWAYSVQPLIALVLMIVRAVPTLVAFLVAARGFSLKYLFSPFAMDLDDTKEMFYDGYLFVRSGKMKWFKKYYLLPLTPIFSFPIITLVILCLTGNIAATNIGMVLLMIVGTLLSIGVLVLIACVIAYFIVSYLNKIPSWYDDQSEIEAIVCDGSAVSTKISKLPQKKRTVYLRYQAMKNKVCKPFAG
jgi:hypothetical protein